MSIDEQDEDYEEIKGEAEGLPFIMRSSLACLHGCDFHIYMDEYGLIHAGAKGIATNAAYKRQRLSDFSW